MYKHYTFLTKIIIKQPSHCNVKKKLRIRYKQYFSIIHIIMYNIIVALILLQRLNVRQNRILHHTMKQHYLLCAAL